MSSTHSKFDARPKFQGFDKDCFQFFRDLSKHNNKDWFDKNRRRYEMKILGTFRGLLESLRSFVLSLNPDFEVAGKTNGNFSRINRDMRFSKDKSPYHANFYCYFFNKKLKRQDDGRLYVGLSGEHVTVGFSIYAGKSQGGSLAQVFKPRLERDHAFLGHYLKKRAIAKNYDPYWYRSEKRDWVQINGIPENLVEWQRAGGIVIRKIFSPGFKTLGSPVFLKEIQSTFTDLYPLYLFTSVPSDDWLKLLRKYS